MAFIIGQVVQLKSGGPQMTVIYINNESQQSKIAVQWFKQNEEIGNGSFPENALVLIGDSD